MRPRRAFRPSPPDPLERRDTPGRLAGGHAHHLRTHRHPRQVHPHPIVAAAATVNMQAVDAGTGPVVGGTAGTGAGATLNTASTYLNPVAPYASTDQNTGTTYGGSTSSATVNSLNNGPAPGPLGSFSTLQSGLNLGTAANGLDGPSSPTSGLGSTATLATGA